MCCCDKSNRNGTMGYKWNRPDESAKIYPINPPDIDESAVLLFDEPGRCGGVDSHSFHYRLTRFRGYTLYVRHGGGDESMRFSCTEDLYNALCCMDSNIRYWIFNAVFHAQKAAAREARSSERSDWMAAALEKRIKIRSRRGYTRQVFIQPRTSNASQTKA